MTITIQTAETTAAKTDERPRLGMTLDELRRALGVIEWMNETFNTSFEDAADLLRLIKVCWASKWDVLPDEWTEEQIQAALAHGTPPTFEETSGGLHALDVADCGCRGCRRAREQLEEETGT